MGTPPLVATVKSARPPANPCLRPSNASLVPEGDQNGRVASPSNTFLVVPVATSTTQRALTASDAQPQDSKLEKAIHRPSGDHAGK